MKMTTPESIDRSQDAAAAESSDAETNRLVTGIGVSGGVAIGQVVLVEHVSTEIYPQRILLPEEIPAESTRFEVAVEEGATLVRVGTAIFGARD